MLRNYARLAYRTLLKNKVASAINLVGLGIAVGVAIVAFLFIHRWVTIDQVHAQSDRIVLAHNIVEREGEREVWGDSPMPLGPALEADLLQVERAVRMEHRTGQFRHTTADGHEQVHDEWVTFVDPAYLDMFDFPVVAGDRGALDGPGAVILSPQIAEKYFGDADPLGESFTVTFDETEMAFTVRAVADPLKLQTSVHFNILLPFEQLRLVGVEHGDDVDDWAAYVDGTFLLLRGMDDLPAVAAAMDRYVALQNQASLEWPIAAIPFTPLEQLSARSRAIRGDVSGGPPKAAVWVLGFIGAALLLLACFNYVNVTLATAARRLKEIGVRKALGGQRGQLVRQFLIENVLLCLLALGLGVFFAQFVLLPGFNELTGEALRLQYLESGVLWSFLVVVLVLTAFVAGAYPAFYIASLRPTSILRGGQVVKRHAWLQHSLLTVQFALAFITMMAGVVFAQNGRYQASIDWGYDQAQTLVVPLYDAAHVEALAVEARQHPDVETVARAAHTIGRGRGYAVIDVDGVQMEANRFDVGFDYAEAMGLRLTAGRFPDRAQDAAGTSVVVNEAFARQRGWDAPVGRTLRYDSTTYAIAGVVADFHYASFYEAIDPVLMRVSDPDAPRYLVLRARSGQAARTFADLEAAWGRLGTAEPFAGYFQDTVFDDFHEENRGINRIFSSTALMALLLASMGLFGIAAQNVARRMREIGIRKALGATVASVTARVNRSFVVMLAVAFVIATPLAYLGLDALLDSIFEYRMPLSPAPFLLAFGVVALAAAATIGTQVRRIVTANPADVLRAE